MPWQTDTETGRYIEIATATENTAFLSVKPITGGAVDWTLTASGEAAEGWTVGTFKYTEDDFTFNPQDPNPIVVDPPTCEQKIAKIFDKAMVPENIQITSYEALQKVYNICTNVSESTGVFTIADTFTRVALIMEIQGLGALYMPSVEISAAAPGGGIKTLTTQVVTIDIFAGSSVTAGFQPVQWQDA